MPVLSSGQVRGLVEERRSPRRVAMSMALLDGSAVSYAELYRAQPAVRTVIGFLARHVAQMGMRAYEVGEGRRRRLTADHPLGAWCELPSPQIGSVPYLGRVVSDVAIFDAHLSVLAKARDGRVWTQPVPRRLWEPVGESWTGPEGFRLGGRNGRVLAPDQVIHIAGYDPDDLGVGASPMEALRQTLAADVEAERTRAAFWRGGARPSSVIERPNDAPVWSEEARDRFMAEWYAAFGPGGHREGRAAILEDGMVLRDFHITARDAQYIETRKLTREEVAAVFDIPGPLVGILDHATFSNVAEQHRALYADTLGWWFRRLEQVFVQQLAVPHLGRRLELSFDEWERMRGSAAEQASTLSTAAGGPFLTRNEARERVNLPPIDGADELIVPLNVVEGGQAAPELPTEVPQPDDRKSLAPAAKAGVPAADSIAGVLRRNFERQRRSTLSRLGPRKATDRLAFDVERFERELADDLVPVMAAAASSAAEAQGAVAAEVTGFVARSAAEWASIVCESTSQAVGEALSSGADVGEVFDRRVSEAESVARSIDADTRNEVAELVSPPGRRKRWRTTSGNPRPTHAALDGVSVGIGERFPNGQRWPGDRTGSAQDFGCLCEVDFVEEGE